MIPARLRVSLAATGAVLALAAASGRADVPTRRIIIVTPAVSDARLAATREAIAFWNQTLTDLTVDERLVETELLVAPPISRALETYTRQIWRLAGRRVPREFQPPPPAPLIALDADIVVFLSKQQIFSFAWPFDDRPRYFVGIATGTSAPLTMPNGARNIIAHEFGHTFGLEHNGRTATLMCGPCDRLVYRSERPIFFPLLPAERTRLLQRHPSAPPDHPLTPSPEAGTPSAPKETPRR